MTLSSITNPQLFFSFLVYCPSVRMSARLSEIRIRSVTFESLEGFSNNLAKI